MAVFKGLVFIKHGRVGMKGEGPDYYLQTKKADFILILNQRQPWKPDFELEFFCRKMVEIEGKQEDSIIRVKKITEILEPRIPEK